MLNDAQQLVKAVLEGESAKDFLRRHHKPGPRIPRPDEVEYSLCAEHEDMIDYREEFDPGNINWIEDQLNAGNDWAWCRTQVTASFYDKDGRLWVGHDYLGGCSYRSRADFMQPGGYYDDMKSVAYDNLVADMKAQKSS